MIGSVFLLAAQVGEASPPAPVISARPIPASKPWYDHLSLQQCAAVDAQGRRYGFVLSVAERQGKTSVGISGGKQFGLQTDGQIAALNVKEVGLKDSNLKTIQFGVGDNDVLIRQLLLQNSVEKTSFSVSHRRADAKSSDFEYLVGFCFDFPNAPEVKQ